MPLDTLVEKRQSFPTLWPVPGWAPVILCLFSASGLPPIKHGYYFAPYTLLSKQKKLDGSIPDTSVTICMACARSQLVVEKAEVNDTRKSDTLRHL